MGRDRAGTQEGLFYQDGIHLNTRKFKPMNFKWVQSQKTGSSPTSFRSSSDDCRKAAGNLATAPGKRGLQMHVPLVTHLTLMPTGAGAVTSRPSESSCFSPDKELFALFYHGNTCSQYFPRVVLSQASSSYLFLCHLAHIVGHLTEYRVCIQDGVYLLGSCFREISHFTHEI